MRLDLLPVLFFPGVACLAALIAWQVGRRRRGLAAFALLVAAFSALLVFLEFKARMARANIRVDLLVTLPAEAVAALILGIAARRASGLPARVLAIAGAVSLATFGAFMFSTGRHIHEIDKQRDVRARLYWQETIRCPDNFERRFGPATRTDGPCRGHFLATGELGRLRFTRVFVGDDDKLRLFFSREEGVEEPWGFPEDSPLASVHSGSSGGLTGTCGPGQMCRQIELEPSGNGGCEMTMSSEASPTVRFGLRRAPPLPACSSAPDPPVRLLGPFAAIFVGSGANPLKELVQLWLWESGDGEAHALLLQLEGYAGGRVEFPMAAQLSGSRMAPGLWELATSETPKLGPTRHLRVEALGEQVLLSGDAVHFRFPGPNALPRGEVVSNPKIAFVPLYDAQRFRDYFAAVLALLSVPWDIS